MSPTTHAIVLAAGKGTRMNSTRAKVCHEVFGEPMLVHVLRSLTRAGVDSIGVVVGAQKDQVLGVLDDASFKSDVRTVLQDQQKGTGHAVDVALDQFDYPEDDQLLVTCGDIPGVRPETFKQLIEANNRQSARLKVLTAKVEDPKGYGRVCLKDDDSIAKIVEHVDATPQERSIDLINSGIMCGSLSVFQQFLPECTADNESNEYYLTDVVELARGDGHTVVSVETDDEWEITGINTRRQLVEFERQGNRRLIDQWFDRGVTVHDPGRVMISPWVDLDQDVEIDGGVKLVGQCSIGAGTVIEGDTVVRDAEIGENNHIVQSNINKARLGDDVDVGPYCHIRPGTEVHERVRLGNFVEIKQSTVKQDTNIAHLSYMGDADVGENVNVGAGTITCNYDGYDKHRTTIGSDVFIGSNTELVAPVSVSEGALVGAGSTITGDVPPDSLALSRVDQETRENWVKDVWKKRHESNSD